MLSRLAFRNAIKNHPFFMSVRGCSVLASSTHDNSLLKPSTTGRKVVKLPPRNPSWPPPEDSPERDHVNFPKPVWKDFHPPVRLAFIPKSCFDFFYSKIGVTGPYILLWGTFLFAMSKEILTHNHDIVMGVGGLFLLAVANNKLGGKIITYVEEAMDQDVQGLKDLELLFKRDEKQKIDHYNLELRAGKATTVVYQARLENIGLQLESIYRDRLQQIHNEVKNRLDYHLEINNVKQRFEQKHMLEWIVNNVRKSISPELEKSALQQCIKDLKKISATI